MDYLVFPYIALLCAIPLVWMIIFLQRIRTRQGAVSLFYLTCTILGWLACNTLELITPTPEGTLLWGKITYLFITSAPVCWLLFVLDYHQLVDWRKTPRFLLLGAVPLITTLAALTNDFHHLIWEKTAFIPYGSFLALKVIHGPLFYVHMVYSQILILSGIALLIWKNLNRFRLYRGQVIWVTFGLMIVGVVNLIYLFNLIPGLQKDYTPIALAIGCICFGVSISSFQLFDIAPMGRSVLFDSMEDGVIAIDSSNRIVDINPAAIELLEIPNPEPVGHSIYEVFRHEPRIIEALSSHQEIRREIFFREEPLRYLNIKTSPIRNRRGVLFGHLAQIRNVTSERANRIAERKARELANALRTSAARLNSSLDTEKVLDTLLESFQSIFSSDGASITLLQKGVLSTARSNLSPRVPLEISAIGNPGVRWMVEQQKPLAISDTDESDLWALIDGMEWVRSVVSAPIIIGGEVIGFINAFSCTPNFYKAESASHLMAFANQGAIALQNARLFSRVNELATRDDLTGLNNRRNFMALANLEIERARRYNKDLSLMMIDFDHYKEINDSSGHQVGDLTLQMAADLFRRNLRDVDICGRHGGDEFSVLLPETPVEDAEKLAERLRRKVEEMVIPTPQGSRHATISVGISAFSRDCATLDDLLQQADMALYKAKENGRNQVKRFKK